LGGGAAATIATIDEQLLNKAGILLATLDFFHTHKRRFFVELTYELIKY
jgi:hypothetical protein